MFVLRISFLRVPFCNAIQSPGEKVQRSNGNCHKNSVGFSWSHELNWNFSFPSLHFLRWLSQFCTRTKRGDFCSGNAPRESARNFLFLNKKILFLEHRGSLLVSWVRGIMLTGHRWNATSLYHLSQRPSRTVLPAEFKNDLFSGHFVWISNCATKFYTAEMGKIYWSLLIVNCAGWPKFETCRNDCLWTCTRCCQLTWGVDELSWGNETLFLELERPDTALLRDLQELPSGQGEFFRPLGLNCPQTHPWKRLSYVQSGCICLRYFCWFIKYSEAGKECCSKCMTKAKCKSMNNSVHVFLGSAALLQWECIETCEQMLKVQQDG